jgi:hypothetical protein
MTGKTLSVFYIGWLRSIISSESFSVSNDIRQSCPFFPALVPWISMIIISTWSFCQQGPKWGPICHCLMMKFLARTQTTSFPPHILSLKLTAFSLYHPQGFATGETVSHQLLRLCERELKPRFHNFKWKALGWLGWGIFSGTSCLSQLECGQLVKGH